MEFCPQCGLTLRIGKTEPKFVNDDTPEEQTEVYIVMPLLCINKECELYAGEDLDNPGKVAHVKENKLY